MKNPHPFLKSLDPAKVICLDAEFAQGYSSAGQTLAMLELSISDANGDLIYSSRFRPERFRRWRLNPHNISPADVAGAPRFRKCLPEIQRIIDNADYITGFALENDFRRLNDEGIVIPDDKRIIELRDWFWILYGKDHGMDYAEGIGNEKVAETLGIEVEEALVHASAYDIHLSLESLNALLHYAHPADAGDDETKSGSGRKKCDAVDMKSFYEDTMKRFKAEKEEYDRERAAGFCYIVKKGEGYIMKCVVEEPKGRDDIVACTRVADRKKALIDLSQMFTGHAVQGNVMIRNLSEAKLKRFKSYSNTYDAEAGPLQAKLLRLAQAFGPGQ